MTTILKHSDCRNFIPVDVAKGICRVSNEMIFIDSDTCENFTLLPKCKNCSLFSLDKDHVGTCAGFKDNYWTYEDNIAVTCEEYVGK